MKNYGFIGVLIFLVVLLSINCSGSNNLNGIWVTNRVTLGGTYGEIITFSGNKFNIEYYDKYYDNFNDESVLVIGPIGALIENEVKNNTMIDGTYSISSGNIELKFSDGSIKVFSFSQTENTITINGIRFTRKK